MGYRVERPPIAGVGEKPTTPKPLPRAEFIKALDGAKPSSPKPLPQPPATAQSTKQK
jgi:hypothetical protein